MPLRHRCGYAAGLPRSLPGGICKPPQEFPAQDEGRVRTASSPDPPGSSWRLIKGCLTPVPRVLLSVPLAGPGPSDGAEPSRLCQGCSRHPRHHPDQAALSSAVLLRQDQRRRSLTSTRINSASRRRHVLRHSCAMSLLQAGVDTAVIALWLGHAGVRSTDAYLPADISIKERALALTTPAAAKPGRYRPTDKMLAFLESL